MFLDRRLWFCPRYPLSRTSWKSAGKDTQIGPRCQSRKCKFHPVVVRHPSCVLTSSKSRLELDWLVPTIRSNEKWREARRLLDRSLGPGTTTSYRRMMEENTRRFLGGLLESPEDFLGHIGLSVPCIRFVYITVNHWVVFKGDLSCLSHTGMT